MILTGDKMKPVILALLLVFAACSKKETKVLPDPRVSAMEERIVQLEQLLAANVTLVNNLTNSLNSAEASILTLKEEYELADAFLKEELQMQIDAKFADYDALRLLVYSLEAQIEKLNMEICKNKKCK